MHHHPRVSVGEERRHGHRRAPRRVPDSPSRTTSWSSTTARPTGPGAAARARGVVVVRQVANRGQGRRPRPRVRRGSCAGVRRRADRRRRRPAPGGLRTRSTHGFLGPEGPRPRRQGPRPRRSATSEPVLEQHLELLLVDLRGSPVSGHAVRATPLSGRPDPGARQAGSRLRIRGRGPAPRERRRDPHRAEASARPLPARGRAGHALSQRVRDPIRIIATVLSDLARPLGRAAFQAAMSGPASSLEDRGLDCPRRLRSRAPPRSSQKPSHSPHASRPRLLSDDPDPRKDDGQRCHPTPLGRLRSLTGWCSKRVYLEGSPRRDGDGASAPSTTI